MKRRFCVFLGILVVLVHLGCASVGNPFDRLNTWATGQLTDTSTGVEIVLSGRVVQECVESGWAAFGNNNFDTAINDFSEAIVLNRGPRARNDPSLTLEQHRGQDFLFQVEHNFNRPNPTRMLDSSDREHAESVLYILRGRAFLGKENFDSAISDFTHALPIFNVNFENRLYEVAASFDFGMPRGRVETQSFSKASIFFYRSEAYYALGNYAMAVEDLTQAVELAPNSTVYRANLERAQQQLNR